MKMLFKNQILKFISDPLVKFLLISYIVWSFLCSIPAMLEFSFLKSQEKPITLLNKYKNQNGKYPDSFDKFSHSNSGLKYEYFLENNGEDFVIQITKYDTVYSYCTNSQSEKCKQTDLRGITCSKRGKWLRTDLPD